MMPFASCSPTATISRGQTSSCRRTAVAVCSQVSTWRTGNPWLPCSVTMPRPVLLADVNTFIYAHRPESPRAEEHRRWLTDALTGPEPFGVSELVLSAFLRIVTNHRVYREPTPPRVALAFCSAVLDAPSAVPVRPGVRHWSLFTDLCRTAGARGNTVPDAFLAALAMEHGATWVTADRGFERFQGLRCRTALDG